MSHSDSSNFYFLQPQWPELLEAAAKAEEFVHPDPRTSCFYSRRTLELFVNWLYTHDSALKLPYQTHLSALIHEPTFKNAVGAKLGSWTGQYHPRQRMGWVQNRLR